MAKLAHVVNSININGPIEAVFDLVTMARLWPKWHPATRAVGGVTERPYQLGDLVQERGEVAGTHFLVTWKVVEHERPSRIVLDTPLPPARITYTFAEMGDATLFERKLEYHEATFQSKVPDAAALSKFMHAQSAEALQVLKQLVEKVLKQEAAVLESP